MFPGDGRRTVLCQSLNYIQQLNERRHSSTTPHFLLGFDLTWRMENSSLFMYFISYCPNPALLQRSATGCMKFHIFTVRDYCDLPTLEAGIHCHSLPHQWQGTAQRRHFKGPSTLLCLNSCDSHVASNHRISEYLVLCWSLDNPRALWYIPVCPPELLFQQCLGFPSVPNLKFSSIYLAAITSGTINLVIVMVTSSWHTDIVVLCKCRFTITCI